MISKKQKIYCHEMSTRRVSADRVLFWDIPKAASSYIRSVICHPNADSFVDQIKPKAECKEHSCAEKTKDVIIGVVRNPYDILVSYFYSSFFSSGRKGALANAQGLNCDWMWFPQESPPPHPSLHPEAFDEFLKGFFYSFNSPECWECHLAKNPFFQMFDSGGELACDYILKVENLAEGVSRISKKFGVKVDGERYKEKINASDRLVGHYSELYSEELKELVHEKYSDLLNLFDYSFEDNNEK